MSWICPRCGKENYVEDEIGRRPPRCSRCLNPRTTPEHRIRILRAGREKQVVNLRDAQKIIEGLSETLTALEAEVAAVQVQLWDHQSEARRAQEAIAEIDKEIQIAQGTPADHRTRRALEDQAAGIYVSWNCGDAHD